MPARHLSDFGMSDADLGLSDFDLGLSDFCVSAVRTLVAVLCLSSAMIASAQDYPTKPIRILHGFGAGGAPDTVLRHVAAKLETRLGQPVIVENRPGASGTIAAAIVARAAPDGQTLLMGVAANLAVAPATMKNPPYDPRTAFTPIVEIAAGPYLWLVRADAPARTMAEFVAWARSRPGSLNYGSAGLGSAHHLLAHRMLTGNGLDLVHVPYKSALPAALLSGEVQALFETLPGPLPMLADGRIRALGISGPRRLPGLPDLPTLAEQGIVNAEGEFWWGLVGPAGLPANVIDRLNAQVNAALAEPDSVALFRQWQIQASGGPPSSFATRIQTESAHWRTLVEHSGLRLD